MNLADMLAPSCALFLDFDGTLVDLAPQPEDVQVPDGLVDALHALQRALGGAVAMVSGRPIAEMDAFLHPLRLPAAGVHGAQRRGADGVLHQSAAVPLEDALAAANALSGQDARLRVEPKPGSVALHYRQAPDREAECVAAMQAAVNRSPGLTLLRGKMVVEAKPGGATKGRAIEAFLGEAPFAGRIPVFVGDDITDEAGFAAVQRLRGLGVKVGEGPTVAWRRIASPAEFRAQLARAAAALGTGAHA